MKEKLKKLPWAFWALAAALLVYGGTKPASVTVAWDSEFFRNGAASVDTNDLRNIGFTWLPAVDWLPPTAQARLSAARRPDGNLFFVTNAPMSALSMAARMPEAATSYLYWVECDWVPEPSVVTNGVYHVRAAGTATNAVPVGARVETAAGPSALPYIRDGLVAMWDGIERGDDPLVWRDVSGHGYDATQRLASAGWRWGEDSYIGTSHNGHGFTTPAAIRDEILGNINGHTIEVVFAPSDNARSTIFGQYNNGKGALGGLNIEYSPHMAGHFRVYYDGQPDCAASAWKSAGKVRITCATVCDGAYHRIFDNGVQSLRVEAKPNQQRIGVHPFILGGENGRPNMSVCGELCAIRLYSRALTADEIRHNYEIDKLRFNLMEDTP